MIGVYDYTVILTYLSLMSGATGIFVSLQGYGHPYIGVFFLLLSGLCDAFDGKVARSKKNRTEMEMDEKIVYFLKKHWNCMSNDLSLQITFLA